MDKHGSAAMLRFAIPQERYPRLMKFKWIYAPILFGFAIMPFVYTRALAAITLALGLVYTAISPFFLHTPRNPRKS